MRGCYNCGKQFKPVHRLAVNGQDGGHVWYCTDTCRRAADRKRRRARRQQGNAVTDELTARAHPTGQARCLHCRQPWAERYDGQFCGEPCFLAYWNLRIPHSPAQPLTVEQVVWSPCYSEAL